MDSSLDLFIIWIFKPIVILVAFLQVGFLLFYSNNLLGNFCFLQENVRVTDRTYLTPDNKLNTKMEASLDLFITWIFKPMVILVACLQVGFFFFTFLFQIILLHQPWRNLLIAWLVFSKQLESTLFNSSLALCLCIMGRLFFLKTKSQIFFRNAWSVVWFHCHSGLTARRKLGRKTVLVPNDGSPEKSD